LLPIATMMAMPLYVGQPYCSPLLRFSMLFSADYAGQPTPR
jgi:hypothetical protein